MSMNKEREVVLALSKININGDFEQVETLFKQGINWQEFIRIASNNKVLELVYHNIKENELQKYVPKYFSALFEDSSMCNYLKNNKKLSELKVVLKALMQQGVLAVAVKGGYLIDNVYKNRRIRKTNDIDILIKRKDISIVDKTMKSLGYISGELDVNKNEIILPNKDKKLLYKTKMYNLLPYVKTNRENPIENVIFDFSFALDFSLDINPINEMLEMAKNTNGVLELLPEHFFVHMCCHHYREASNVAWILIGKDLNLIKFCDVREFVLQKMDPESIRKAIDFAKKYKLEKSIYFTMFFVKEIYNDGYEDEILKSLDISDESFLYEFGENDYDEMQIRKKDFWESIFSDNNIDEITKQPKYKKLI